MLTKHNKQLYQALQQRCNHCCNDLRASQAQQQQRYNHCCNDLLLLQCLDYFIPCLTRVRFEREHLVVTTPLPWFDPPYLPDRIGVEGFSAIVARRVERFGGAVLECVR